MATLIILALGLEAVIHIGGSWRKCRPSGTQWLHFIFVVNIYWPLFGIFLADNDVSSWIFWSGLITCIVLSVLLVIVEPRLSWAEAKNVSSPFFYVTAGFALIMFVFFALLGLAFSDVIPGFNTIEATGAVCGGLFAGSLYFLYLYRAASRWRLVNYGSSGERSADTFPHVDA
ncbi:MAG: hypothetical protein HND43_05240 [Armatimonadetes bacterium]|nr:hypothetical protein [Armatimonadota bacterium]NOG38786.1 hypothetical protein [Armatimonadota bacterium]